MFKLLFGFDAPVSRRLYIATGAALMALKYGVEAAVFWAVFRVFYTPLDFLNPAVSARASLVGSGPSWLPWAWLAWTIPFLWIAVGMTLRRAWSARAHPWVALLMLFPYLSLVVMIVMAILPDVPRGAEPPKPRRPSVLRRLDREVRVASAATTLFIGTGAAFAVLYMSIYVFHSYGATLFLGVPLLIGATTGARSVSGSERSAAGAFGLAAVATVIPCVLLLVLGLEGGMCIVMALVPAIVFAFLGVLAGRAICRASMDIGRAKGIASTWLVFLALVPCEAWFMPETPVEVLSAIDIPASPDTVWRHLISFPPIDAAPEWFFRLGISTPLGARIEGEGEGAVRHCQFSTGDFVEPITCWEQPRVLAFDVQSQPPPMRELSPFGEVHPPHLDGFLSCRRGEFRLVPTGPNATRLEGRTWFALRLHPAILWLPWSSSLVHAIHHRVLSHIRALCN